MLFSSQIFIYCFLPALLLLYFPCRKTAWRNAVLLVFSLLFYGWGKPVNLLLMFGVVGVNYIAGRLMGTTRKTGARKLYLFAAVALSLSALGFFKYAGFFTEIVNWIPGVNLPVPQIELPLGISFFTFQALTYSVDVYRRDVQSQRSFFKVLLYVSLFPQLVAGPIVQYADVDAQLDCHPSSAEEICDGVFRFAVGLGRKVLLADTCYTAAQYFLNAEASSRTVLGAWMGCIVGALLILVNNPMQALWFVVMFLVIQQLEGNLIYPHVMGNAIGLPSIWVLFAVVLGEGLLGIMGMLLFIPLTSVAYALLKENVARRLERRQMQP